MSTSKDEALHNFFFVKCFIDADRADILVDKAADFGISSPHMLKLSVSRDGTLLEKLGMSSVDIMLTLKGLEKFKG